MAVQTEDAPAVTTLVSGIVHDAQQLLGQQLQLFQHEIKSDLRKTKDAAIPIAIGAGIVLVGIVLFGVALGHLLSWIWPQLPLWACFAIAAALMAVVGGALVYWGKKQFDAFNPLPEKSLEALKENVQWVTKT
jgi:hypothetical protein